MELPFRPRPSCVTGAANGSGAAIAPPPARRRSLTSPAYHLRRRGRSVPGSQTQCPARTRPPFSRLGLLAACRPAGALVAAVAAMLPAAWTAWCNSTQARFPTPVGTCRRGRGPISSAAISSAQRSLPGRPLACRPPGPPSRQYHRPLSAGTPPRALRPLLRGQRALLTLTRALAVELRPPGAGPTARRHPVA